MKRRWNGAGEDEIRGRPAVNLDDAVARHLVEKVAEVKPVYGKLGPAFKDKAKAIVAALKSADPESIATQIAAGKVVLATEAGEVELGPEFFEIRKILSLNGREVSTVQCGDALLVIEQ